MGKFILQTGFVIIKNYTTCEYNVYISAVIHEKKHSWKIPNLQCTISCSVQVLILYFSGGDVLSNYEFPIDYLNLTEGWYVEPVIL